ncbi:MAG: outer membrane beta-barrel protein [Ignavibacteriales bacterium]|nr:outer membrane beta-barrel protein [Ignavibacteriales bacterium]
MRKSLYILAIISAFLLCSTNLSLAQGVLIGPRVTGNLNIYNAKGLTGTWNGIGVGVGGTVDLSFSKNIGMMVNLTAFDMKNFSNSITNNNQTTETSLSLSYFTLDPMFKAEFSGFYMLGGASFGVKINSSGERTQSATGQAPTVTTLDLETKSIRFDFAVGTGYNFKLSPTMYLGADFIAYIPITDTYNFPGQSNSILSLKLGASLKFKID